MLFLSTFKWFSAVFIRRAASIKLVKPGIHLFSQ